jgi:hypothetical protein
MPDPSEILAKLKTPKDCEQFAINVEARGKPELAISARRAIELRALEHNATSDAELESLEAVYAYERVRSQSAGKKIRASHPWQMINRLGIIPAVDHLVSRPRESVGYTALIDMGMEDKAFGALVLRHPEAFSEEAVERSRSRLRELQNPSGNTET